MRIRFYGDCKALMKKRFGLSGRGFLVRMKMLQAKQFLIRGGNTIRIIIIGAVAAGTSATAKAKRNNEEAEIIIYEKDRHISYSACGMPYYLAGEVEKAEALYPRDPRFFREKYNVDIRISHEVLSIDPSAKSLKVKNLETGEEFTDSYDILIYAAGARAFLPIPGKDLSHVFTLRSIRDMHRIEDHLRETRTRSCAIIGSGFIGSGFIGIEMAESFQRRGLKVSLIELLEEVTPAFDADMGVYIRDFGH